MMKKFAYGVVILSLGLNILLVWMLFSLNQENTQMKQGIFTYHVSFQEDILEALEKAFENRDDEEKFINYLRTANEYRSAFVHFGYTPLSKYFFESNKFNANIYDYDKFTNIESIVINQAYKEAQDRQLQKETVSKLEKYKIILSEVVREFDSKILSGKTLKEYFLAIDNASRIIRSYSIRREVENPEVNITSDEAVSIAKEYIEKDKNNILKHKVGYMTKDLDVSSNLWVVMFQNDDLNNNDYELFRVHVYIDANTGEVFEVECTYRGAEQEVGIENLH